ncbi:MAG: 3-deoxy-manno-octulosonate cytidylyltransferase [Bacteroides sp.]|nr:3-deoxy-manno-octulosonate cytidylyltransferase [Bacteroides sp.]
MIDNELTFKVLIPARYSSTRFPGKPLAKIGGKEMILHVCERASEVAENIAVATDDERIAKCVLSAGFEAVMTSTTHRSGTDRVYEAYCKSGGNEDVIINIQGDEPFVDPAQIELLMGIFRDRPETQIATLVRRFDKTLGIDALFDANKVKVVKGMDGRALYFSRSVIPYIRGTERDEWVEKTTFFTHIGIYAYRADVLGELTKCPQTELEICESLEQLRWLENGYTIQTAESNHPTIGIDTPEDLAGAEALLARGAV